MKKILKLHHHKHTGKLLHHRHTSYPALFVVGLLAGVYILLVGQLAHAADLAVTATVPATIPPGKPIFTAPSNGITVSDPSVRFEGTCPLAVPAIIIVLKDGTDTLGSAPCTLSGDFSIDATIASGLRSITATVMTITNGIGETSDPLTITYKVPVTSVSPTTTGTKPNVDTPTPTTPAVQSTPLVINLEPPFVYFNANRSTSLKLSMSGGDGPYNVTIDWGDDSATTKTTFDGAQKEFAHIYTSNTIYIVRITVSDKNGQVLTRNYAAVSGRSGSGSAKGDTTNTAITTFEGSPNDPAVVVPVLYGAVMALILLLWRYELIHYPGRVGLAMRYSWQHPHRKPHSKR